MNSKAFAYFINEKKHHENRFSVPEVSAEYAKAALPDEERMTRRFEMLCDAEIPHIEEFEKIVYVRTVKNIPDVFTEEEWKARRASAHIHETGYVSNLCPDYAETIRVGLLAKRENADPYQKRCIDAILRLSDRYAKEAERLGREDLVRVFSRIPREGATNLREALQFFRILHFSLWLEGDYHNTVGRFDQYMFPYFAADMKHGTYDKSSALELLEDFFLSFNKDSDLYFGQQQGDNGQSMMLGGMTQDGTDGFNALSELCLLVSEELKVIDPKINLRVGKNTPMQIYELGTRLTKAGLGFPQYSNDDVVIPGLVRLGYAPEDAVNYTVAACWEFIIPGVGDDIANIAALNLPLCTDRAIRKVLSENGTMENLLTETKAQIQAECDRITGSIGKVLFAPSPVMDLLRGGRKYHNYGIHGCGVASAADALAAVEKYVFEEKTVSPERLLKALDSDYQNDPELFHLLRYEAPKTGMANENADRYLTLLLDDFSSALAGKKNAAGGIYRAGTGTAMYYLWHAKELGATADGRKCGEALGTNYSPNLFTKVPGPVSDIESFTTPDLSKTVNGGPLTLEFASGTFRSPESIRKVASLVKYFIDRGGHQLQLNSVNLEAMKDAQIHPEVHRNLVVRIWGWSAYFVELDRDFQNHVIARQEYTV